MLAKGFHLELFRSIVSIQNTVGIAIKIIKICTLLKLKLFTQLADKNLKYFLQLNPRP